MVWWRMFCFICPLAFLVDFVVTVHAQSGAAHVRLVGGSSPREGRVEVFYNGEWGTVCNDDWDLRDATVACRSLGYATAVSALGIWYGEGSGPILLDQLDCRGDEGDLGQCWHNGWGIHNCGHGKDAAVVCSDDEIQRYDKTYYRLFGGASPNEGVLQFRNTPNETWTTMCYNRSSDLVVFPYLWAAVCHQLGYKFLCDSDSLVPGVLGLRSPDGFGIGDFPLERAFFSCPGSEGSDECSLVAGMADHAECTADEAVWLQCDSVLDFRLGYGFHESSGLVLARCSNTTLGWKAICGYFIWLQLPDVPQVFCRHLGYSVAARSIAYVIPASALSTSFDILLDGVFCFGNMVKLVDCDMHQPHEGLCYGYAGLNCSEAEGQSLELKLVDSKYEASGVLVGRSHPSDEWGAICRRTWDHRDAQVACRHLGHFTSARVKFVHPNTTSPALNGTFLSAVGCNGFESDLSQCESVSERDLVCDQLAYVNCVTETERFDVPAYLCGEINYCGFGCNQRGRDTMLSCKCDSLCGYFGDCCYDYQSNCEPASDWTDHMITGVDLGHYACAWVPRNVPHSRNWGYVLVSFCPKPWADASVRQSCEKMPGRDDVIATLPVFNKEGAVYKNVFCAACHEVPMESLQPWSLYMEYVHNVPFHISGRTIHISDPNATMNAIPTGNYFVEPPRNITIRSCPVNTTKSCLPEFRNTTLESACKQYFAPVDLHDTRYHNLHCAMCNGLSVGETETCGIPTLACIYGNWEDCKEIGGFKDIVFTVEALFDFGWGGDENPQCRAGELFDPFLDRCRKVLCVSGRLTVDGDCLPLPVAVGAPPAMPPSSLLDKNCTESINRSLDPEVRHWQAVQIEANQSFDVNHPAEFSLLVITQSALASDLSSLLENHETILRRCYITEVDVYASEGASLLADLESCENFTHVASDVLQGPQEANSSSLYFPIFRSFKWKKHNSDLTRDVAVPMECLEVLALGCPQVEVLLADEFSLRDSSRSITHTARGKEFQPGEFALLPQGQAAVCGPVQWTDPSEFALGLLAATFVTYCTFPELRNMTGLYTMNLVVALFVAIFLGVLASGLDFHGQACVVSASLVHLSWLSAFSWMALLSCNAAIIFGSKGVTQRQTGPNYRKFLAAVVSVWGCALLVVSICLILQFCNCTPLPPIYSEIRPCVIADANVRLIVFGVPVATSLLISGGCFVFVISSVRKTKNESKMVHQGRRKEEILNEVKIYVTLSVLFGVTWILAFVSELMDHEVLSYINVIVNTLQGVFIFVAFCLNQRGRALWGNKLPCLVRKRGGRQPAGTSSGTQKPTCSTVTQPSLKPDDQETCL